MATSRSAGTPAAQPSGPSALDTLITQVRRLRGSLAAVRRETVAAAGDAGEAQLRWQRSLCDLAARQLDSLTVQLGQLRESAPAEQDPLQDTTPPAPPAPPAPRAAGAAAGRPGMPAGRVGSAEWHLRSDGIDWSDELFAIFGRPREQGPLSLDDLPAYFVAADQPRLTAMVTDCLVDGKPMDGEFRIRRDDGDVRALHIVGEPVLDPQGATASMWAVVRDISELHASRQAVSESRAVLQRRRHLADAERRLAVELHESVLPPWRGVLHLTPGEPAALSVGTHYFPAGAGPLIGGDWYDVQRLPEGRTLLSVGDLAGHGVPAASGMAMLLGALRGMALTSGEPGPLLAGLNELLDPATYPALVSAVCCRYDTDSRTLVWAQAGHPPPLLFRDGTGRALEPPAGVLLGATAEGGYAQAEERLRPGDLLLLYTDGLCPHSARPAEQRLLDLAPRFADDAGIQDCLRAVIEEFGGGQRTDDACVLIAKVAA